MKTIIIATDFSKPAGNAARYALNAAKYLKSNMILCHAFTVPADATVAGHVVWPQYDYEFLLNDASEHLDEFAKELMLEGKSLNFPNTFKPVVEYITEPSGTVQLLKRLAAERKAGLVVAGISGAGAVSRFFTGSTSRALIESASFPVLLIPPVYAFKPVNKIAFATDLNKRDIEVIHSLAGFARYFDAELVVVHVDQHPDKYDATKADLFLNEVTCKINYDKVYYREVSSSDVNQGLDWLSEHGWIDMLVMVHRHASLVDRLIKGSLTKNQIKHVKIPLLVLPEGLSPVF